MLRFCALLMAGLLSLSALAFERPFPANALRGKMTPGYFPDVSIDGKPRQLSPAARIFNRDNMIEMPAGLRGSDIVVNYTVDFQGFIDRIWILTAEEAAQKLPTAADTK
ncbi:hypothetical protein [Duganella sp. S19_KUP01_CR8]|uniref:hypothetical protein n=1 Tax=Duganella sp. S19_KUP01_CR8 TaxID=3025502 RepID=UPI002FCDB4F3